MIADTTKTREDTIKMIADTSKLDKVTSVIFSGKKRIL